MANPAFDYRSLNVADRLQLVGDIRDSIAEEASTAPEVLPLTPEQKAELDRRLASYDADPSTGAPMGEAFDRVRAGSGDQSRRAVAPSRVIAHGRRRIVFTSAAEQD